MLVWLGALVTGAWWVWPLVQRGQLTADLVAALVWLVTGAAAWVVALNFGWRRYRPR
jgi:hypothetical protein